MNKSMVLGVFLYVFSLLILLFGLYLFLNSHTFSKEDFLMGSGLTLMVALVFGYILNSHALSQKFEIDKNLLHLTQEILHELNIPLSTIQANTMLLKRTLKENEKALLRLSRIDASTIRLERLYTELVYSIKKEIHPIDKEVFDVSELVEERVDAMRLFNRNPFLLSLNSLLIKADKIGFEKVLDNLLTNAMKYSGKSEVIQVVLEDGILSIHDRGIGMDETELVKVYERYYQLDKDTKGEGIGLALVKAYCDDEQIELHISSEKGKGSTFALDLKSILF